MDSKTVNKAINAAIRPILKENGFDQFTGRTYWRHHSDRIDILNFQSFNAYNADVIGCTTFSFAINRSCFLNYIPSELEIKSKNGQLRPREEQAHFRSGLNKGITQQQLERKDIWFVDTSGSNLDLVIDDSKNQIEKAGLSWYNDFSKKENVLDILMHKVLDMNGTWGFGNLGSAVRNEYTAYTAKELGEFRLAVDCLTQVSAFYNQQYENQKYPYYLDRIKSIEEEIKKIKTNHNKT